MIYLLPPSIYLILRGKKNFLKIFLAVIIFGLLFAFIFDFIQVLNNAYFTPAQELVIPWLIFGIEPVDYLIGYMLMTLFIVVFYEHFLDDEKIKKLPNNFKNSLLAPFIVLVFIIATFFLKPVSLEIKYSYVILGLLAILPSVIHVFNKPRFLDKFLKLGSYFFFVWFLIEMVAIKNGYWLYHGQYYIGWVKFLGLEFPFEELFFWMMLYAVTIVSYYERFIDDNK